MKDPTHHTETDQTILNSLRKNIPYQGVCTGWRADGSAVVEALGLAFSVPPRAAAPGDELTFTIINCRKLEAVVTSINAPSPARRSPPCEHFGICGGCSLQHLPYPDQAAAKQSMVEQILASPDHPPLLPLLGAEREFEYRNKMEYTFSTRSWQKEPPEARPKSAKERAALAKAKALAALEQAEKAAGSSTASPAPVPEPSPAPTAPPALGFFVPFSGNKVLDLSMCRLQGGASTAIRNWFSAYGRARDLPFYNANTQEGFLRTLLIRLSATGQTLVMIVLAARTPEHQAAIDPMLAAFSEAFGELASIWYCINNKLNDSYADLTPVLVRGSPFLEENLGGLQFRVGPLSFMQVNPWQTVALYDLIMEHAGIGSTDLVYDLYCGAGTISSWAARKARKVLGLEYVAEAVEHARDTARINGLDNVEFHGGDMKDLLSPAFISAHGNPDIIITDPPRAGMHADVTRLLCTLRPRKLVYVSCKAESLKRDLELLKTAYRVTALQAIDLMPQTIQIETIAVLEPLEH